MAGGTATDGQPLSKRNADGSVQKRNNLSKRGFRAGGKGRFSEPIFKEKLSGLGADATSPIAMGCDSMITPACIATLYNITQAKLAAKGNELGIFEGQFPSCLELFVKTNH